MKLSIFHFNLQGCQQFLNPLIYIAQADMHQYE